MNGGWLQLLSSDQAFRLSVSRVDHEAPEAPDPLVAYWKGMTRRKQSTGGSNGASPAAFFSRTSEPTREKVSLIKQRHREANAEMQFWSCRAQLLKREVEKLENEAASKKIQQKISSINEDMISTLMAQLEQEREKSEKLRQERMATIKAERKAHHEALYHAISVVRNVKYELSSTVRMRTKQAEEHVRQEKSEIALQKSNLRHNVQQNKVTSLLTRVRDRALREEETARLYEHKMARLEAEEVEKHTKTLELIQESSKLVQRLRVLREQNNCV
jgi:hypothetical protein